MFATLTATPRRMRTTSVAPIANTTTSWMTASPSRMLHTQRLLLAPGIWIVREKQWWPTSVLDTMELLPWDSTIEPEHRNFPEVDWHAQAACVDHPDADALFFGVDAEANPALSPTSITTARALCRSCSVIANCLTWALTAKNQQSDGFVTTGERFGIWGGTTGRQRALLQLRIKSGERVEDLVNECLEN